jgi:hypothetical protein
MTAFRTLRIAAPTAAPAVRPSSLSRRFDGWILRLACDERRLIGLSVLRVVLGVAAVLFYISDYGRREYFWGPHSYNSPQLASAALGRGLYSFFLVNGSEWWFELVFHLGLLIAVLFTIFGGRVLTLCHAAFMWSLYSRNQDILEGGDNLARIVLIFMVLTVSNAYLAPGARRRRERIKTRGETPQARTVLHNLGAFLIVFQIATVYFWSGYWKIIGTVWQQGVSMYYISRINSFHMLGLYSTVMANPFVSTAVAYATVVIEVAFPFVLVTRRAWLRKLDTLALEGLHLGIIACMGLVCFGLIMIGADFAALRDEDYRSMRRQLARCTAALRTLRKGDPYSTGLPC